MCVTHYSIKVLLQLTRLLLIRSLKESKEENLEGMVRVHYYGTRNKSPPYKFLPVWRQFSTDTWVRSKTSPCGCGIFATPQKCKNGFETTKHAMAYTGLEWLSELKATKLTLTQTNRLDKKSWKKIGKQWKPERLE